jgi:hypothetical protein
MYKYVLLIIVLLLAGCVYEESTQNNSEIQDKIDKWEQQGMFNNTTTVNPLIRRVIISKGQNQSPVYLNLSPNDIIPIIPGDVIHMSYYYHPEINTSMESYPFITAMYYKYSLSMTYFYDLSLNFTEIPQKQYMATINAFGFENVIPIAVLQIPQPDGQHLVAFKGVTDIQEIEYWIRSSKGMNLTLAESSPVV